jgi:hypothetical protein
MSPGQKKMQIIQKEMMRKKMAAYNKGMNNLRERSREESPNIKIKGSPVISKRPSSSKLTANSKFIQGQHETMAVNSNKVSENNSNQLPPITENKEKLAPFVRLDLRDKAKPSQKQREDELRYHMSQKVINIKQTLIEQKSIFKNKSVIDLSSPRGLETNLKTTDKDTKEKKVVEGGDNLPALNIGPAVIEPAPRNQNLPTKQRIQVFKSIPPSKLDAVESTAAKIASIERPAKRIVKVVELAASKNKGVIKNSGQKGIGKELEEVRAKTRQMHLLWCTLHGCCVQAPMLANEQNTSPILFFVGPGNNQKLVYSTFKNRENFSQETFIGRSLASWTQTPKKFAECDAPWPSSETTIRAVMNDKSHAFNELFSLPLDVLITKILENRRFKIYDRSVVEGVIYSLYGNNLNSVQVMDPIRGLGDRSVPSSPFLPNHIRGMKYICKKHLLFSTVFSYCLQTGQNPATIIPKTYLIRGQQLESDVQYLIAEKNKSLKAFEVPLIIKPGENANRGNGILIAFKEEEVKTCVDQIFGNRKNVGTVVAQDYMTRPLLFKGRKFDIRCYALVVKLGRVFSFYWYNNGYARTSSFSYDLADKSNLKVHLTNEAVQVKGRPV